METTIAALRAQFATASCRMAAWAEDELARLEARRAAQRSLAGALAALRRRVEASAAVVAARRAGPLRLDSPETLPVAGARAAVQEALRTRGCLVLTGETGSGKTTQLPKMLLELGYGGRGELALTQPRRVAAISIAARLAEEMNAPPGIIAHAVRFDDRRSDQTRVAVVTDGLLLAEAAQDPELLRYDAVIVDEAHERSLNIDVLLGLLRRLRLRRPELVVVVTSATIEAARIAVWLGGEGASAPVIEVAGRTFPVEIRHEAPGDDDTGYLAATVACLRDLHLQRGTSGDILAFLPTERDILEARRRLQDLPAASIVPLFGRLNPSEQQAVFRPTRGRKIVLATNIAETSLTVPGITAVVDAGLARIRRYAAGSRVERLPVEAVAQANLAQRAGRAGRVAPGLCIRLMDAAEAAARPAFLDPEIKRSNLAGVLLRHLDMGLGEPADFPWLDPPSPGAWQQARGLLAELGALEPGARSLTALGRRLARIPADPQIAAILLAGRREGCAEEACTLAAWLSTQEPRLRPPGQEEAAERAQLAFHHEAGDLAAALTLWQAWSDCPSASTRERFCRQYHLSHRRMREWADLRRQLHQELQRLEQAEAAGAPVPQHAREKRDPGRGDRDATTAQPHAAPRPQAGSNHSSSSSVETPCPPRLRGESSPHPPTGGDGANLDHLHRAVLAGMLGQVACYDERERSYRCAGGRSAVIHPGSVLRRTATGGKRGTTPPWLLACEQVETSRLFLRAVAPIDPLWVIALAGERVKRSHRDPHYDPRRGRVVCHERILWKGLTLVADRIVPFGPIDAEAAHELFLQQALAGEAIREPPAALADNRVVLAQVRAAALRLRDRSLEPNAEVLAEHYRRALGAVRLDGDASLRRWLRQHGPRALELQLEDLLDPADAARLPDFPDVVLLGIGGCEPRSHGKHGVFTEGNKANDSAKAPVPRGRGPNAVGGGAVLQGSGEVLPLHWRFAPGDPDDGATLELRERHLALLAATPVERLVPGWLPEQIRALLEACPKDLRRRLIPLGQTAAAAASELRDQPGPLDELLRNWLSERFALRVESLDLGALPPWLRPRLLLRDDEGAVLADCRDPEELLALGGASADPLAALRPAWRTAPGCDWPGDCPERVEGQGVVGFPVLLRDRGPDAAVAARRDLLRSATAAAAWHQDGVAALVEAQLAEPLAAVAAQGGERESDLRLLGRGSAALRRALGVRAALTGLRAVRTADDWQQESQVAQARLANAAVGIPALLDAIRSRVATLQQRLRRGLSGLGAAQPAAAVRADLARLLAGNCCERLDWPALQRLPLWLDALALRLDEAERAPSVAARLLPARERLLDDWLGLEDPSVRRLVLALGRAEELRRLSGQGEELLASLVGAHGRRSDAPALGASLPRWQRDCTALARALAQAERDTCALRAELHEGLLLAERIRHDLRREALRRALTDRLRSHPDLSLGADLEAQRSDVRELLRRVQAALA